MSKEQKKILIAGEIFPPDIGGPATYTKKLASSLGEKGWQVTVICYAVQPGEEKRKNYILKKISRHQPFPSRYAQYFSLLFQEAKKNDFIYAQGPIASGLPATLVASILNKKFFLKVVGDYAWEQARRTGKFVGDLDSFLQTKPKGKAALLAKAERSVATSAEKVIVPSQYLKKVVEQWGVPSKRIKVIYNGISLKSSAISLAEARKEIGREERFVFTAGRLVLWKGFALLIKIWPKIKEKQPDLKLVIAGEGPEEKNLRNLIKEKKLESDVFLVGKVAAEKMPFYFRAAEFFLLNSAYEGLPHIVLESLREGTPVIASQAGGNGEVVEEGKNGFLIPYNKEEAWQEKILFLAQNKEKQEELKKNIPFTLKKFSWEKTLQETQDCFLKHVYESIHD